MRRDALSDATASAEAAATRADVQIETLTTPPQMERAAILFASVWGTPATSAPLPHDALSGIHHAGGCVLGAFRGGALIGAAVAVAGSPQATELYGMLAGVDPAKQTRGVGTALKQAQRVFGLRHGARTMRWTYDPFLRGNAVLNLNRLGATGIDFVPEFYAPIADELNASAPADRLIVQWDLECPHPERIGERPEFSVTDLVARTDDGGPEVREAVLAAEWTEPSLCLRVALPDDILALRHHNPDLSVAWHEAYRATLPILLTRGFQAVAVESSCAYRFVLKGSL